MPETRRERLKLIVAYDGHPFRGWQSQTTADAVQDHLEQAFATLVGERVVVHGAGRTDAGVHALGQVAHADVPWRKMEPMRWQFALNAHLPDGIRILRATRVPAHFHARFHACGKIYTYRIWNETYMHPLEIGRAWHVPTRLDLDALRQCALVLEGTHDFAGFAANRGTPETDTVRRIDRIEVIPRGALLVMRYRGEGFLYKMVRLLTGSLVRCAQRRADAAWLERLLAGMGHPKTHFMAPAEGLYLTKVLYDAKSKSRTERERSVIE